MVGGSCCILALLEMCTAVRLGDGRGDVCHTSTRRLRNTYRVYLTVLESDMGLYDGFTI
jgi:hypothetical protein